MRDMRKKKADLIAELQAARQRLDHLEGGAGDSERGMLDAILSATPDHVYLLDRHLVCRYASRAGAKALGLDREDIVGHTWRELGFPSDIMEPFEEHVRRVFETGQPQQGKTDFPLATEVRNYEYDVRPASDTTREEHTVVCTVRDVTDRVRTDRLLHQIRDGTAGVSGEGFLRTLVLRLADALGVAYAFVGECVPHDPGGVRSLAFAADGVIADDFAYALDGSPCADVIGRATCSYPIGVQARFPQDLLLQERGVESYVGTPLFDSQGTPLGILVLMDRKPLAHEALARQLLEIFAARAGAELERRRADRELRNSSSFLALSQRAAGIGSWQWDLRGGHVAWSVEMYRIHGVAEGEFPGTPESYVPLVHPEDRPAVEGIIEHLLNGGAPQEIEYRLVRPSGEQRRVIGNSTVLRDADNQPIMVIGIVMDITDQWAAERAAKLSEARYRDLVEGSLQGTVIYQDGRIRFANRAAADSLGYTQQELTQLTREQVAAMLHPADRETTLQRVAERLAGRHVSSHVEYRVLRKDGAVRWLEALVTGVEFEGQPALCSTTVDITDRKRADEALMRRGAVLTAISNAADHLLRSADWHDVVDDLLDRLGRAGAVSRVHVFANEPSPDGEILTRQLFEWVAAGVAAQVGNPDLQPFSFARAGLEAWREELAAGRPIVRTADTFTAAERGLLEPADVLSLLVVPVFADGTWWGAVRFDDCGVERVWEAPEIDAIRTFASLLGGAIERERAAGALRQRESHFHALVEDAWDVTLLLDKHGVVTFATDSVKHVLGYRAAEFCGRTIESLAHPNDVPRLRAAARALAGAGPGARQRIEGRARHHDGSWRWIEAVSINRLHDPRVGTVVAHFRDISARKAIEDRLRLLEAAVEYANDMVVVTDAETLVEPGPRIVYTNPAFSRITGYDAAAAAGRSPRFLRGPETDPVESRRIGEAIRAGRPVQAELLNYRADGTTFWVEMSIFPLRDQVGRPTHWVSVQRDVTARRESERTMRESEARYRNLFEESRDAIYITTLDGSFVDANASMLALLGYSTAEELAATKAVDAYADPADRARFRAVADAEGAVKDFEVQLTRKDGSARTCLITSAVRRNSDGEPVGYQGVIRDISEQKLMQDALVESEQRFRAMFQTGPIGITLAATDGRVLMTNRAYQEMLGFAGRELQDRPLTDLTHAEDRATVRELFDALLAGDRRGFRAELRQRRKDGSLVWTDIALALARHANGDPQFVIVTLLDVSDRKRAELGLRQSEERYRRLVEGLPDIVYVMSDRRGGLFYSSRASAVFRQPLSMLYENPRFWHDAIHPDDVARVDAALSQATPRQRYEIEYRIRDAHGQWRWLHDRSTQIRVAGTERIVEGLATDITERRWQEQERRDREARLRIVTEQMPAILWTTDAALRFTSSTGAGLRGLRLTPNEVVGMSLAEYFGNDDPTFTPLAGHLRALAGESASYEQQWDDHLYDTYVEPLVSEQGEIVGTIGLALDVTERRTAEAALRVEKAYLEALFESSPDAVVVLDVEGVVRRVNREYTRLFGYRPDEVEGTIDLLIPQERAQEGATIQRQLVDTAQSAALETTRRTKDGTLLNVSIRGAPIVSEGHVLGVYGSYRDITDRIRIEHVVRESRQRLRDLAARLNDIREEERTAIAREIHDELGQVLTGLKMDVAWLKGRITRTGPAIVERCRSMDAQLMSAIDTVRDLASRLRPAVLDYLGLTAAIEWEANEFAKRTGVWCHCTLPSVDPRLSPQATTAIFRIFQESLTNVARHAACRRVEVALHVDVAALRLIIWDDGRGITAAEIAGGRSLGLIGMRERAGGLGGRLDIRRREEGGTIVTLTVPVFGGET
ncbi:MAG TPA: PAS domain S-box protein [Gemmatimonadales bacterium]